MQDIDKVRKYGKFYNPAWEHYGSETIPVYCDNCGRPNLSMCIGWGNLDLCMICTESLPEGFDFTPYTEMINEPRVNVVAAPPPPPVTSANMFISQPRNPVHLPVWRTPNGPQTQMITK